MRSTITTPARSSAAVAVGVPAAGRPLGQHERDGQGHGGERVRGVMQRVAEQRYRAAGRGDRPLDHGRGGEHGDGDPQCAHARRAGVHGRVHLVRGTSECGRSTCAAPPAPGAGRGGRRARRGHRGGGGPRRSRDRSRRGGGGGPRRSRDRSRRRDHAGWRGCGGRVRGFGGVRGCRPGGPGRPGRDPGRAWFQGAPEIPLQHPANKRPDVPARRSHTGPARPSSRPAPRRSESISSSIRAPYRGPYPNG